MGTLRRKITLAVDRGRFTLGDDVTGGVIDDVTVTDDVKVEDHQHQHHDQVDRNDEDKKDGESPAHEESGKPHDHLEDHKSGNEDVVVKPPSGEKRSKTPPKPETKSGKPNRSMYGSDSSSESDSDSSSDSSDSSDSDDNVICRLAQKQIDFYYHKGCHR